MNLNLLFDMESLDWADMSIDKSDCLDKIQDVISEVQNNKRDGKHHELFKPLLFDNLNFDQLFNSDTLVDLKAEWFIRYAYSTFAYIHSFSITPNLANNLDELITEFPDDCNALLGCHAMNRDVVYDLNSYEAKQLECVQSRLVPFDPEAFLKNEQLFQKLAKQYHGKTIYKHIETGQYWYLDNFHKQEQGSRHFEVFNSTGQEHMGEADLDGNLDTSKASNKKKLTL